MWKIKDKELRRKINQFVTDDEIDQACQGQINDKTGFIALSSESDPNGLIIQLDKPNFEFVDEYNPDNWNKFPQVKPPFEGMFLVTTVNPMGRIVVITSLWTKGIGWHAVTNNDVLAFREYPQPYLERRR